MIHTAAIIDQYDKEYLKAVADAFLLIHSSGILVKQVKFNSSQLAEGFQERSPEELMKEILQVQQTNRGLLALHEFAGNFRRELDDA